MIKTAHSAKLVWVTQFFSYFGLLIAILTLLAFLISDFHVFRQFIGQYRFSLPIGLIFLAIGSIAGLFANRKGLEVFVLLLPLTPNLHFQLQEYFGFNYFSFVQSSPGLDLVVGFACGVLIHAYFSKKIFSKDCVGQIFIMPWQIGLALCFLFLSSCLAILRNIRQSASHTSFDGVLFNVINFRTLGWHDDFMPLADLFTYGMAALTISIFLPILGRSKNPVYAIFHPLALGIILAAMLGVVQSVTGIGLPNELLDFRYDRLGFVAIGFQPDLHSYASHMLLGAVGFWGYFFQAQNSSEKRPVLIAIILSWCALLLSKSRASLILAILVSLAGWVIFLYHSRKKNFKQLILILIWVGASLFVIFWYLLNNQDLVSGLGWLGLLITKFSQLGFGGLSDATQNFGGRPEIYLAGLRMWSEFPLIGLGQGEFFRQSAEINFSHSFMLSRWGGENAHNYFLQVLVENGLIGFLLISYAILFPCKCLFNWQLKQSGLVVAVMGLGALLLGNVFAHSLLIRENLILSAILVALMYSQYYAINSVHGMTSGQQRLAPRHLFAILAVVMLIALSFLEVYRSFGRYPFLKGVKCVVSKPLSADGWTSGIYEHPVPAGSKGVRINVDNSKRFDIETHPLKVRADIVYFNKDWSYDNNSLTTQQVIWSNPRMESLDLKILDNRLLENNRGKLVLRLSDCYVPKNLGQSLDGRSLGIQLMKLEIY